MIKFSLKKILSTALVTSMVAGTVCAYGATSLKAAAAPAMKKIVVWSNNRHDLEYMNKMVKQFNDTNKLGIQIDYVVQTDNWQNMITMAASSGQLPDVMAVSASDGVNIKNFADAKIIQPINQYITSDFTRIYNPSALKYEGLNSLGSKIYWIPTAMRSGSRLIYNKDLFTKAGIKPPKTIKELVADAKKITAQGDSKYYGVIFPGQSGPFGRWIEGCAELSGIKVYDYAKGKFDFSGMKPFIQSVRQMFDDKSVFPGSASMKIDPIRTEFAAGNVGIHGNASQEVGVLTQQFPAKMPWGVADLPTLDGKIHGALSITPNFGWMMSAKTKDPKAAWAVINYFGSESFMKGYLEGGYSLPNTKYMDSRIDKSKTGRLADFSLKSYESVYPQMPQITPQGEYYGDVLWSACLSGGPDIDKTLSALTKSYNDELDKEIKMGKVKRVLVINYDKMHPSKGTVVLSAK